MFVSTLQHKFRYLVKPENKIILQIFKLLYNITFVELLLITHIVWFKMFCLYFSTDTHLKSLTVSFIMFFLFVAFNDCPAAITVFTTRTVGYLRRTKNKCRVQSQLLARRHCSTFTLHRFAAPCTFVQLKRKIKIT